MVGLMDDVTDNSDGKFLVQPPAAGRAVDLTMFRYDEPRGELIRSTLDCNPKAWGQIWQR
jgi:hypothetical protein